MVAETAEQNACLRPRLDETSASAIRGTTSPAADPLEDATRGPDELLWAALSLAPDHGITVPELMQHTGMSRPWIYQRLRDLLTGGQVIQVSRGRWRGVMSDAQ